jgi:hypothetical protein
MYMFRECVENFCQQKNYYILFQAPFTTTIITKFHENLQKLFQNKFEPFFCTFLLKKELKLK